MVLFHEMSNKRGHPNVWKSFVLYKGRRGVFLFQLHTFYYIINIPVLYIKP